MKSVAILLLLTAVAKADFLLSIGESIGYTYTGVCQGLQDDPTITTSSCVSSCDTTYTYIVDAFDLTTYTGGTFSSNEFSAKIQTANTYIQSSLNTCKQMEFILALNLRYVHVNYLVGSLAKLGVAIALDYTGDMVQAVITAYNSFLSAAYNDGGIHVGIFLKLLIGITSPDVVANNKLY